MRNALKRSFAYYKRVMAQAQRGQLALPLIHTALAVHSGDEQRTGQAGIDYAYPEDRKYYKPVRVKIVVELEQPHA